MKDTNGIPAKKVKVVFGLEAQGHLPTIERILNKWNDEVDMTYSIHVWEEIGREIGWCPFTAALHYFNYMNKKNKAEGNTIKQ